MGLKNEKMIDIIPKLIIKLDANDNINHDQKRANAVLTKNVQTERFSLKKFCRTDFFFK